MAKRIHTGRMIDQSISCGRGNAVALGNLRDPKKVKSSHLPNCQNSLQLASMVNGESQFADQSGVRNSTVRPAMAVRNREN
jgi:hypothetical protein